MRPSASIQMARTGIVPPTPNSQGTCKRKCPGGYACTCNAIEGHALHICRNVDCWCHSQDRYEGRRYDAATNWR